jgi:type IV secretory pathway VirB6-like protein
VNASLTIFTAIWNAIVLPIQAAEQPMVAALQTYVTTWFALAVAAYIVALLLMAAFSPSESDATLLFRQIFLAGIVWSIAATAAGTNLWVTGLINGAINSVSTAIAGTFGGAGAVLGATTFDKMGTQLFAVGLAVAENVPGYAIVRGLVIGCMVDCYAVLSIGAVAVMFVIYMISNVILQFVLGFSPLFVAFYMFQFSRFLFDGWLRVVIAAALMQVFIVALLTLFLTVLTTLITSLTTGIHGGGTLASPGGDIAAALYVLLVALAMTGIFAFIAVYLAMLAMSISGGAHASFSRKPSVPGMGSGGGGGSSGGGGGGSGAASTMPAAPPAPRNYAFQRSIGSDS